MNGSFRLLLTLLAVGGLAVAQPAPPEGRLAPVDRDFSHDTGSIIRRFVEPLTRPQGKSPIEVLGSDEEHAYSAAPILTPDKPLYISLASDQVGRQADRNYILDTGRIFQNFDFPFDPNRLPRVHIRPIDAPSRIPFLIRATLTPTGAALGNGSLELSLRFPAIFHPSFTIQAVSLDGQPTQHRETRPSGIDEYRVSIPIGREAFRVSDQSEPAPVVVLIEGVVQLERYEATPPNRFGDPAVERLPPALTGIARMISGRDFLGEAERVQLQILIDQLQADGGTAYSRILAANRLINQRLRYYRNTMRRTAAQILTEGMGDCDDYTRVMIALLRGMGIPSKLAVGELYDFNSTGGHAWVEAALPDRRGTSRWFMIDPTLASVTNDKDMFVQFINRIYLYPIRFNVQPRNLAVTETVEILLNWRDRSTPTTVPTPALLALLTSFREDLLRSLRRQADALRAGGLLLPREYMFAFGSSYLAVDRPVVAQRSRLHVRLDNQDRLWLELGVVDEDHDIENPVDQQVARQLREAYQRLKQAIFRGAEARHNLELTYTRDKHTDRLQKMSLRLSRYLVERHFGRLAQTLGREGLLRPAEIDLLERLHKVSSGRNIYYLQELARFGGRLEGVEPFDEEPPSADVDW